MGARYTPGGLLALPILLALPAAAPAAGPEDREGIELFEREVRPVIVEHCYRCHSADARRLRAGLRLDTSDGLRSGGDSGPAIVPGDADASLLVRALRWEGDLEMPPRGRLPEGTVESIARWIERGAPDPRAPEAGRPAPAGDSLDVEAARSRWAFTPPRPHTPPEVRGGADVRGRIDRFVLARLEGEGLEPAPPADRRTLARRVSFDLTGLPPAPAAVERFVRDRSPLAWERFVDRVLSSPAFGEHWARMWLDLARYAEDQAHIVGNNRSLFYPNAWIYREWVIRALNEDLPYDRFVELQLAADVLEPDDEDSRAALGFLGLGPKYYGRGNVKVKADEWEDRVDVVTRGLLGLTVACARCHDHKYDPIPTEDYYALAGVFASTEMYNRPLDGERETKKNGQAKSPGDAMHVVREGEPKDLHVFVRGDPERKGPLVQRRFLTVFSDEKPEPFDEGSGRAELARAIASPGNPLTSRVIVNRVWARLFGRGIVATPSNFGRLGGDPTHPDLLDDLAARFAGGGWSLKRLVREIVTSAAYRRSSRGSEAARRSDPENRLLARASRKRLRVEAWRDTLLAVSGRLDRSLGGESVEASDPDARRRTVYARVSRFQLDPLLALFDFPDPNVHSARRARTTTPLQKLSVLNGPFVIAQAEALAGRLLEEVPPASGEDREATDRRRIERAYRLLYARSPRPEEVELGLDFLAGGGAGRSRQWAVYAQALLASNELIFVD